MNDSRVPSAEYSKPGLRIVPFVVLFTVTVVTLTRTLSKYTCPPTVPPTVSMYAQLTRPVTHVPLHGARLVTPNLIHVSAGVPFVSFAEPTTLTDVAPPAGVKNSSMNCA